MIEVPVTHATVPEIVFLHFPTIARFRSSDSIGTDEPFD
jgi:hypothetical protein